MFRRYILGIRLLNTVFTALAFLAPARNHHKHQNSLLYNYPSNDSGSSSPSPVNLNKRIEDLKSAEKKIREGKLVQAALGLKGSADTLLTLSLNGKALLPTTKKGDAQLCLVLSTNDNQLDGEAQPTILCPLLREWHIRPVQAAYANVPLSMPILLRLNSLLVNRDDSLFDNLPWSSWTIDPLKRNRDAAGNTIDPKFHLGKRDAYNVMLGKDWSFRSSSRALKLMSKELEDNTEMNSEENQNLLAQRLISMQIRELEMDVAELDYQLAVMKQDDNVVDIESSMNTIEFQKEELVVGLDAVKEELKSIRIQAQAAKPNNKKKVTPLDLISKIFKLMDKREAAPYRGATGYQPYFSEDRSYNSPYDMLVEIIENQLKAQVIGCVLENTSLFEGTMALGGALVLRRMTAKRSMSLEGTTCDVSDEEEDYGNAGVEGGEVFVVECSVDEAVGVSLASAVELQIESDLWTRSSVMAQPLDEEAKSSNNKITDSGKAILKAWRPADTEMSVLVEGQARNQSATERISPIRIPRSTALLYDALFTIQLPTDPNSGDSNNNNNRPVFPTDNPIKSLSDLDALSNQDKARTLISMSNFQGNLPRPRVVRQAEANKKMTNPLNELLLPLIDESVRRQYLIRDAEQRGDMDTVRELKENRSARQRALEAAEGARARGEDREIQQWEEEAEFLESLKADVTQDEGSYSRFLDRDDWYERERQKHAKKLDKKKFGSLLDGIE